MKENRKNDEKPKSKKWQNIIAVIYALSAVAFFGSIALLGVLPGTYLTIVGAALLLVSGLVLLGVLSKKEGKGKVFCGIIAALLSILLIAGTAFVSGTMSFFQGVTERDTQTFDYYVVVKSDSAYKDLADVEGKKISVLDSKSETDDVAKQDLLEQVTVSFDTVDTLQDLTGGLMEGALDVIFISAPYYDIALEETENFTKKNTRILYTVCVEKQKENQKSQKKAKKDLTKNAFHVYISGIDTEGSITNVSRSDVNMIMTINPTTRKILLTSIPRDYHVVLSSFGAYDKLTHSGIYGIDETTATIEDLLGIKIDHYVKVNFTTVTRLVDALGGIEVESDYAFTSVGGYSYQQGTNYLNGEEALYFARERYAFSAGDNQRVKNQQAVITGILKKATGSTAILTQYSSILSALEDNLEISLSKKQMASLIKMQLGDMRGWDIETISLTGSGSYAETYSMPGVQLYVMEPNQDSIDRAKAAIARVMKGTAE